MICYGARRRKGGLVAGAAVVAITGVVLLAMVWPAVAADGRPQVSGAQFYVVGTDGRSVPDPAFQRERPEPRLITAPTTVPDAGESGNSSAKPRKSYDTFDEMRCEQFGFYYTKSGRCIVPAGTRMPPRNPRR